MQGDSGAGSGLGWPARCPRWVGHGFQTETRSLCGCRGPCSSSELASLSTCCRPGVAVEGLEMFPFLNILSLNITFSFIHLLFLFCFPLPIDLITIVGLVPS